MVEKGFVDALIATIGRCYGANSVTIRPNDSYTLGIPDVLCWRADGKCLAIEAKQLSPLMPDPFHKGRRTGLMLKHPFMGPQISMLRRLDAVGVEAFGLIRMSTDVAFRIEPKDIPAKTGNFTYEDLRNYGRPIYRRNSLWEIWRD